MSFSQVGRATDVNLFKLRQQCQVDTSGSGCHVSDEQREATRSKVRFDAEDKQDAASPKGALARAILERLQKKSGSVHKVATSSPSQASPLREGSPDQQRLQPAFMSLGFDAPWTSKFTMANTPGCLSRSNEQRPDPCSYQVQWNAVIDRIPSCDFKERPKHQSRHPRQHSPAAPRSVQGENASNQKPDSSREVEHGHQLDGVSYGGSFLTSVDLLDEHGIGRNRSRIISGSVGAEPEAAPQAEDLLEQDIKGYPKLRYPHWDFAKPQGRVPLIRADTLSAPGKYEIQWRAVEPAPRTGIAFHHALSRSDAVAALGHLALPAALHSEEKRSPGGCLPDRSRAKDLVRQRPRSVNDFSKDTPRPSLYPPKDYSVKDPAVEAEILHRALSFDIKFAEKCVRPRQDVAPLLEKMVPRGRGVVHGIRDQPDFVPAPKASTSKSGTDSLASLPSSLDYSRELSLCLSQSSSTPPKRKQMMTFDYYTQFQPTLAYNNFNHGHAPVRGAGPAFESKQGSLRERKANLAASFERKGFGPGFTAASQLPRQNRSYQALPNWTNELG